jgi:predicted Zn-dependent protease
VIAARVVGAAAAAVFIATRLAASPQTDREIKQGNAMFATAQHEGSIVTGDSSVNADVEPITAKLFPVLQKSYGAPFSVAIVRAAKGNAPDAYTLIGPRIYIDTAFPAFIKDRESLAGVMCHEANHVLHHDALRSKKLGSGATVASSLAQHTRAEEEHADLGAVTTCAQSGFNPWGIVWALRRFESAYGSSPAKPPILADHPSVSVRIARLTKNITSNSKLYGRWKDDESKATPLR